MPTSFNYKRPIGKAVVPSSTNVPTAFSTAAGSLVLTGLANNQYEVIEIHNLTATEISYILVPDDDGVPSATSTQRHFVPAQTSIVHDKFPIFNNLYIQSEGSAISAAPRILINVY